MPHNEQCTHFIHINSVSSLFHADLQIIRHKKVVVIIFQGLQKQEKKDSKLDLGKIHIKHPHLKSEFMNLISYYGSWFQFPTKIVLGGRSNGSSDWIPATYMGDLHWVLASHLWCPAQPERYRCLGSETTDRSGISLWALINNNNS